jgi:hypothetical protein
MTEFSKNKEFSENEETSENEDTSENEETLENKETSKDEEILCRFRITEETTMEFYEFNLRHPLEIFRSSGSYDDNRSLVATIQPRNKKFQEDERIVSLTIRIGNRVNIKPIFCYNGHEKDI